MRVSSTSGPDNIPIVFLKSLTHCISRELSVIFFKNDPSKWKFYPVIKEMGIITPLYKGNKNISDVSNYRPVTNTDLLSKFLKKSFSQLYEWQSQKNC